MCVCVACWFEKSFLLIYFYSNARSLVGNREKRLVKALYDFEAVEENELTFHTGDVINILDDR